MERALRQFVVRGIETSISLHQAIFADEGFAPENSIPPSWSGSWPGRVREPLNKSKP